MCWKNKGKKFLAVLLAAALPLLILGNRTAAVSLAGIFLFKAKRHRAEPVSFHFRPIEILHVFHYAIKPCSAIGVRLAV